MKKLSAARKYRIQADILKEHALVIGKANVVWLPETPDTAILTTIRRKRNDYYSAVLEALGTCIVLEQFERRDSAARTARK